MLSPHEIFQRINFFKLHYKGIITLEFLNCITKESLHYKGILRLFCLNISKISSKFTFLRSGASIAIMYAPKKFSSPSLKILYKTLSLLCYNPWGVQTFVVLFITEGQYTVFYRGTSVGRQQRRCDSIRCKCSQFLMNMIIRTFCVHFTIHNFQITSLFSCCLKYNFLYT